jgi:hypothetical protein
MSEKVSDIEDKAIKYGGGPASTQELLARLSRLVLGIEEHDLEVRRITAQSVEAGRSAEAYDDTREVRERVTYMQKEVTDILQDYIRLVQERNREKA